MIMQKYLKSIIGFLISFGLGFGLIMLSSELLASPDQTAFWFGFALTLLIAFAVGSYTVHKIKTWLQEAIDPIENEESI